MKIEMSMIREEDKFHANSWWATSPGFVLLTLRAHLAAAMVIWPELSAYHLDAHGVEPKPPVAREHQRFEIIMDTPDRFVLVDNEDDAPAPFYATAELAQAARAARLAE